MGLSVQQGVCLPVPCGVLRPEVPAPGIRTNRRVRRGEGAGQAPRPPGKNTLQGAAASQGSWRKAEVRSRGAVPASPTTLRPPQGRQSRGPGQAAGGTSPGFAFLFCVVGQWQPLARVMGETSPREGPGAGETPCAPLSDAAGFRSERGPWLWPPSQPLSTEVEILRLAEQGPPEAPAPPRGQDRCPRAPSSHTGSSRRLSVPCPRSPVYRTLYQGLANGGPWAWSRKVVQTMGAQPCPSFTFCSWLLLWRRDRAEWLSHRERVAHKA